MASGVRQTHQAVWSALSFHSGWFGELIEAMLVNDEYQGLISLVSSPLAFALKSSNIPTKRHCHSNRSHQTSTSQNEAGQGEILVRRQAWMRYRFPKYCSNMKRIPNSWRFPTNICERRLLPLAKMILALLWRLQFPYLFSALLPEHVLVYFYYIFMTFLL